jgi:hypothetical protein
MKKTASFEGVFGMSWIDLLMMTAIAMVVLAACSGPSRSTGQTAEVTGRDESTYSDTINLRYRCYAPMFTGGGSCVGDFRTEDGTLCAFVSSLQGGAHLSCDWSGGNE